ncbi:MAG: hypothetical protein K6A72_07000 [Lachnospiraceae bacterium]|nr:hypothetical protein [Lachnospiraceae bacterium]
MIAKECRVNVYCVMAFGLKYCEGEFDVEELFKQADELMYLDKKARKEKGGNFASSKRKLNFNA